MKYILIIFLFLITFYSWAEQKVPSIDNKIKPNSSVFNPGLLFPDGIEPGDPQIGEAPKGNRNWYVDANAPEGGNGTFKKPFNSFEKVVGYRDESGKYIIGLLRGGDYLYVRGTFKASVHNVYNNNMKIDLARSIQGGTFHKPTVIKSWRGAPRAVFDGEFKMKDLISVKWFDNNKVVIQNIEVKRANGRGILIDERVRYADIISVLVHHGISDGIMGTGGGITFKMVDLLSEFTLCHSVIHDNIQNPRGLSSYGVDILSAKTAFDGSKITLYNNVIYNEFAALGHKHSGNITMNAFYNIIGNSRWGFYLRAYHKNDIHHNLLINMKESAFMFSKENLQGDFKADIYNNTIVNCNGAIGTTSDQSGYKMDINFYNNIYYSMKAENVIFIGKWRNNVFDISGWKSTNNIFYCPNSSNFLIHQGVSYNSVYGLKCLSDSLSIFKDPIFRNVNNMDFRIAENSPARKFGTNGNDIGAFSFGSRIVLKIPNMK